MRIEILGVSSQRSVLERAVRGTDEVGGVLRVTVIQ